MLILHTCIINVPIKVERKISQFILWGSDPRMPKLEVSYFVILLNFAPSSICSWWISSFACLTGKDGNDTVFISSHSIKWFMISICPNIDDVHLDHLIKVVAVKLLHCQVTLSYLVIKTFFCISKYIHILFLTKI